MVGGLLAGVMCRSKWASRFPVGDGAKDSSSHLCPLQGLVGPCGRLCILVGQTSLYIPLHKICMLKSVKSGLFLGQYAPQSSH